MVTGKIWKISVIGDQAVGKTSLVRRFVFNTFNNENESSDASRAYRKKVDGILLMIWDVSVFEEHVDRILTGSKAIIIVGDITRYSTYETMEEMASYLNGNRASMILVGNKSDLKYRAQFWKDELKTLSEKYSASYFFTSAKTGENVADVFHYLIENAGK